MTITKELARQRKENRKRRKIARKRALKDFAEKLKVDLPKSEKWFLEQLSERNISIRLESNVAIFGYIPDFINREYRFIIEIDGSIHDLPEVKQKDKKKDRTYKSAGYTVFRITAYDDKSLSKNIYKILAHIKKNHPKVIESRKQNKKRKDRYRRVRKGIEKNKNKEQLQKCSRCENPSEGYITYGNNTYKVCSPCKKLVMKAKSITSN